MPARFAANAAVDPTALIETSYSFLEFGAGGRRLAWAGQRVLPGVDVRRVARGARRPGRLRAAKRRRLICDAEIAIAITRSSRGNVVLMNNYHASPLAPGARRAACEMAGQVRPGPEAAGDPRPIRIGRNVWIGFDACVLRGDERDGSVVGPRWSWPETPPSAWPQQPRRVLRRLRP